MLALDLPAALFTLMLENFKLGWNAGAPAPTVKGLEHATTAPAGKRARVRAVCRKVLEKVHLGRDEGITEWSCSAGGNVAELDAREVGSLSPRSQCERPVHGTDRVEVAQSQPHEAGSSAEAPQLSGFTWDFSLDGPVEVGKEAGPVMVHRVTGPVPLWLEDGWRT
jgi:hypothetical protein